ncbi:MAG: Tetratricopeptide 1 repeat-containing protein [Edaphobacter sp.]|nr:Tetratricopeptide 1 repeat-containing protein [Edaphobacter sp.]
MRPHLRSSYFVLLLSLSLFPAQISAQKNNADAQLLREVGHRDPQWLLIQPHLPDPMTATPDALETAADVLRARRFPADALEYYGYSLQRGGEPTQLLNKMGVTALELRNAMLARTYFQRAIKLKKKNSEAWNNLGAVEYLERSYRNAISAYKRAIKIDKKSSTYHSNLGTAYFELKDFESARKEYGIALQLDPLMFEHRRGMAGVTAHMLSPEDHARFCFEMARLYAKNGDEAQMLHSLTMASEGGFDVEREMGRDASLAPYRKDPRVLLLLQNARALRAGRDATAVASRTLPPLPPPLHE